jgi:WD repeat-containing protein 42A
MYTLVRERELSPFSERHCRRLLSSNWACVQRMEVQQHLEGHHGCVNTVSFDTEAGDVLISGSDDLQIMLWDWEAGGYTAS